MAELAQFPAEVIRLAKRKAHELESLAAGTAMDEGEDDDAAGDEPAAKRRRTEKAAGLELMDGFLAKVHKLKNTSFSQQDQKEKKRKKEKRKRKREKRNCQAAELSSSFLYHFSLFSSLAVILLFVSIFVLFL